jgi:MFS family permease
VLGTMVTGAGTGVAYASMPALVALGAPRSELAAANGLNALSRLIGSSTASAIGGTILASSVIVAGGVVFPSLTAYQILFALCAGAALTAAGIALIVPYPAGYSPGMIAVARPAQADASPARPGGASSNVSEATARPPAVE